MSISTTAHPAVGLYNVHSLVHSPAASSRFLLLTSQHGLRRLFCEDQGTWPEDIRGELNNSRVRRLTSGPLHVPARASNEGKKHAKTGVIGDVRVRLTAYVSSGVGVVTKSTQDMPKGISRGQ